MSDVTANETRSYDEGFLSRSFSLQRFDDRIDIEPEITAREVVALLWRVLKVIASAKLLFVAKFVFMAGLILPGLMMPWLAKLVIDNVVLEQPLGASDVPYPPFMTPLLTFIDGMEPMSIMLTLTAFYALMAVVIGSRGGEGNYVELYSGSWGADAAAQAENATSGGWSEAGGIWGIIEFWVTVRLVQRIANTLRTRLFRKLTRLPMTTLDDQRIGDGVYRVLYDSAAIPETCIDLTLGLFFMIVGAVINMYLIRYSYGDVAPVIVWAAWAILPLTFLGSLPAARLIRRMSQNKRAAGAATTNAMEESVDNIDAVQSLGGMDRDLKHFAERSKESFFRERFDLTVLIGLIVIIGSIGLVAGLYVTIVVTDQIIDGEMTPGDFGVLIGIFFEIAFAAFGIGGFWIFLQGPAAAIRRVFFFIDYDSDDDRKGGTQIDNVRQGIRFEGVDLVYPNGYQALRNISLDLEVGQITAIVGPTGAGKTSLAYLIPAFLHPTLGAIRVDGRNVDDIDIDALRDQTTYVFQEHLLLSESIRENLLIANPDATADELTHALDRAGCLKFLRTLPEGVDTVLGKGGGTLSVGQQQRLCIARGLLRDTSILILDEPTAALDPASEHALAATQREIAKGRLVVVIAHRFSTIKRADRIVFLDGGEIKAIGTHDELVAQEGPYQRFVELQGV